MTDTPAKLTTPLTQADLEPLRTGDSVLLSGAVFTARDAAHARMAEAIATGQPLPFDPEGQVIYFVGPTPARPGHAIGSAGPTTATRMDPYSPLLIERGLRGMIGKGRRGSEVRAAMLAHGCVYFGAIEGTAALLARRVRTAELVAYPDLETEAIRRLEVVDFPVMVVNDLQGGDLYEEGPKQWRRQQNPSRSTS
jgi:fumarate hydratase subunit beta